MTTHQPPPKSRQLGLVTRHPKLTIVAVAIALWTVANHIATGNDYRDPNGDPRISLGEDLLIQISDQPTAQKLAGIAAVRRGDYLSAIQQFQLSLLERPDDPETAVYLNNARSLVQKTAHPLRIAVSLPMGKNPAIAQEMLRGIAQAQEQINAVGVNGVPLEIQILNDDNDENTAAELARIVSQDPTILGVIGSNDSTASLAAARVYQNQGVVMMTPTSFAKDLTGFGPYIFRTIPGATELADRLATYTYSAAGKRRVAICHHQDSPDSLAIRNGFSQTFKQLGGQIVLDDCILSDPAISLTQSVNRAIAAQADALLISPRIDRQPQTLALVQANAGRLALFSSSTMYTSTLLSRENSTLNGLVVVTPWHPKQYSTTSFLAKAEQRWGNTSLTWRTATSFEATHAIATALGQVPPNQPVNRETLQQQLRSPGFISQGAGRSVQFLPTGDRAGQAIMVRVQPGGKQGYEFAEIQR